MRRFLPAFALLALSVMMLSAPAFAYSGGHESVGCIHTDCSDLFLYSDEQGTPCSGSEDFSQTHFLRVTDTGDHDSMHLEVRITGISDLSQDCRITLHIVIDGVSHSYISGISQGEAVFSGILITDSTGDSFDTGLMSFHLETLGASLNGASVSFVSYH